MKGRRRGIVKERVEINFVNQNSCADFSRNLA